MEEICLPWVAQNFAMHGTGARMGVGQSAPAHPRELMDVIGAGASKGRFDGQVSLVGSRRRRAEAKARVKERAMSESWKAMGCHGKGDRSMKGDLGRS